jgi:hypothetical protein
VIRIGDGEAVEPEAIGGFEEAAGPGPCPFIPGGARADPAGDG